MKQILIISTIFLTTQLHALTVTKTYAGTTPVSVDGTLNYAVALTPSLSFTAADFYPGASITKVTTSIKWRKTDGTCAVPASGNAFHNETNFRLNGPTTLPTPNVILAKPFTWSGATATGDVTTVFSQTAASIPSGIPVSGTFKPNDGNLNVYNGNNPVGNWYLSVGDTATRDPLCVHSYSISIDVPDEPNIPLCGDPVPLAENKWIQISRPCGTETNPTIAEVFASSQTVNGGTLGTYGDDNNWVVWKFDGTNPLPSRSDRYIMITDPTETMKLGVGYWFITSDENVTWDIADDGDTWYQKTVNTVAADGTFHGDLNDPDVEAFRIVNPIADSAINYIRDNQDVLLGNPFNKPIKMKDVYVSNDNGSSYIPLINAGAFMSTRAYVSDISAPEAQPYRAVSATGTPGIGTEIPVKEGAWFYMHGGYSNHANIRIALPLQK